MVNYTETPDWFIRQYYENTERFFILQYGLENKNEKKQNKTLRSKIMDNNSWPFIIEHRNCCVF